MVVKACQAMVFAKSRGQTPVTHLTLKGRGHHLNSIFPVNVWIFIIQPWETQDDFLLS